MKNNKINNRVEKTMDEVFMDGYNKGRRESQQFKPLEHIEINVKHPYGEHENEKMIIPLKRIRTVTKNELTLENEDFQYIILDGEYEKIKDALIPSFESYKIPMSKVAFDIHKSHPQFVREYLGQWVAPNDDSNNCPMKKEEEKRNDIVKVLRQYVPKPVHPDVKNPDDIRLGDWVFFKNKEFLEEVNKAKTIEGIEGIDGMGPYVVTDIFYDSLTINVGLHGITSKGSNDIRFNINNLELNTEHHFIPIRIFDKVRLTYEAFNFMQQYPILENLLENFVKSRKPQILEVLDVVKSEGKDYLIFKDIPVSIDKKFFIRENNKKSFWQDSRFFFKQED